MKIKLNCSKFLMKINKKEVIKNLFDFNLGSVLTEVVGLESNIETKAFLLIFNTSRETNMQLAKAYGREQLDNQYNLVSITKKLESEYKEFLELNVTLTEEFFKNVIRSDNQYMIKSFNLFSKFCKEIGIVLPEDIRLNYYIDFRENLKNEFQNHKERYQELIDFFKNPVALQNDKFAFLLDRHYGFKSFYTNLLQQNSDTKETLKDLYIEPLFSIHKNNLINKREEIISEDFELYSKTKSIHEFFNEFFLQSKKHNKIKDSYDMVFVLGQPGQGKTSFCYKLLYDYIEGNSDLPPIPIIFVKIRDLVAKDFINNPFETVSNYYNFMNFKEDEMILVLDGLDEAYMSGGITNEDLRNLYERLKKRSNKKIKIILTSRFNFLNVDDSCLDDTLVLQLNELTDEQINKYCLKFKKFYPENLLVKSIKTILENEKYKHVKELLKQAVLIYFIAVSNIKIDKKDSRTKIYDKIFDSLSQRSWDENGQLNYISHKLKDKPNQYKKYLREFIRNIAFEIYQSPKLYITVNKLLELDATKNFIRRCFDEELKSEEKIKEISKYLLISFYFQHSNNDKGDTALEFFHNSLWEYLTAEYFWEENKKNVLRKDDFGEFEMLDKEEYFTFLDKIIGNKKISEHSIQYNLFEIIENEDKVVNENVFNQTIELLDELKKDDFLLFYDRKKNQLTAYEKSAQIFSVLWIFIHETNKTNPKLIQCDERITDFLFFFNFLWNESLFNVEIIDQSISNRFIFEAYLDNVFFMSEPGKFHIENSLLKNVSFSDAVLFDCEFYKNDFINVKFNNCNIENKVIFKNNSFQNIYFENVKIENKDWLSKLIEENNFIDKSYENFKVISKIENNYYNNEKETNYYIVKK
ncbi:nSTAND3 domain-containing NTPase [Cloacibacterium normanense]|nr:NACHT domain-containing protein [Cloacibacterium normanense]AZI69848.1 NACHT domain-containing protein [Cloacibacterium normanense]SDO88280.1 NACHT domain-containing protein [Cloacibacterium normanense]